MNDHVWRKPGSNFDRIKLFGFSLRFRKLNKSFTDLPCRARQSAAGFYPDSSDLFERERITRLPVRYDTQRTNLFNNTLKDSARPGSI